MKFHDVFNRIIVSKPLQTCAFALLIAAVVALVDIAGILQNAELRTLDWRFQYSSPRLHVDTNIVLVEIDQQSLDALLSRSVKWPWPRDVYASIVEYLHVSGAKCTCFDILFSGRGYDTQDLTGSESDSVFAESMKRSGNVLLVASLYHRERDEPEGKILDRYLVDGPFQEINVPIFDGASPPLLEFQEAAKEVAVVTYPSDADGIVRRLPLACQLNNKILPCVGLGCYMLSAQIPLSKLRQLVCAAPLLNDGQFLLCWYGNSAMAGLRSYPFVSVMRSALTYFGGGKPDLPPSMFMGKTIIVGPSSYGLMDLHSTPTTTLTGIEIQATMLSNLTQQHFVRLLPGWLTFVVIAVLSFVGVPTILRIRSVSTAIALAAVAVFSYCGFTVFVFYQAQLWCPLVTPSLALLLSIGVLPSLLLVRTRKLAERERRLLEERENTRMKAELTAAHDVQMSLMPLADPSLQGFDVTGICKPSVEVGGDYFDYAWLDKKRTRLGIAIADVSGKAMKAAMTAVLTSGMISREVEKNQSPKMILGSMNYPLYLKTDRRVFTAMSFAVLDAVSLTLTLSNAGQMRPILRRSGVIESIETPGPRLPLGITATVEYHERTVQLCRGDVVMFFTDGVPEAMNEKNELYGFERLEETLRQSAPDLSARQMLGAVLQNVVHFSGSAKQHDDMTLVIIRVL